MVRAFETHKIRKTTELSSSLWHFHTLAGEEHGRDMQVMVPGCWETYPETMNYRGKGVYTRTFEAGGNVRLEFKGVSHTATVYVDGEQVATHYNAYTPFDVVLPKLASGEHTLQVVADNSFGPESALHIPNDYQSYGGISRAVVCEEVPETYIEWLHFTPIRKGNGWYGKVEVCLRNLTEMLFVGKLEICYNGVPVVKVVVAVEGKESHVVEVGTLPFEEAKEWSPEAPELSYITVNLENVQEEVIDDLIDRVGFREVHIEGKDILLNGRKLLIKGFCRHEDHPQFGCAIPYAVMQYDLMLAKDMGVNSIRTAHYPNDELFLDLCDEQGILVWEENHARGLNEEHMRNPNFERQCEDCISEMITTHYNHPCIYIWGILNECASQTEYGKECYAAQYGLIQQLDPYRPRSSASCMIKCDICLGLPEVVSYNIYPKWYFNTPVKDYLEDLYQWIQTESDGAGKPFLVTEIGAGAIYGYRTPTHVKWSEEYQQQALQEQLEAVFAQECCSGVYIWQFCDGRVSDECFSGRPRTMNNKGIVDEYRRPKLAYETVKSLFRSKENYRA
ncbi:MAG: hypothetical protein IJ379_05830 [Lachnospiraceae bacterium]|nr:hypothetical protein [Lachnospiraceae bacterium]